MKGRIYLRRALFLTLCDSWATEGNKGENKGNKGEKNKHDNSAVINLASDKCQALGLALVSQWWLSISVPVLNETSAAESNEWQRPSRGTKYHKDLTPPVNLIVHVWHLNVSRSLPHSLFCSSCESINICPCLGVWAKDRRKQNKGRSSGRHQQGKLQKLEIWIQ